jgi:uncharacterized RDD family membrane protein YckC
MFGIGKKKEKVEPTLAEAPAAPAAAAPAVDLQPAGFWLRVVALIVDYGVLFVLLAVMMTAAESVGGTDLAAPVYWLWVLITFFYWPVLESTARRGTVGKMALGLVVGDIDGGGLNFLRSLLRNLAKIISSIPLGIGFLLAAFTARKQALHDLITKAVVMRRGPASFVRAIGVLVAGIALNAAGGFLMSDTMMGALTKDMEAMVGADVAGLPAKPAAQAPARPAAVAKPAAPAPASPPPVAAAKPAPSPAPLASSAPAAPAPQAQAASAAPASKPAAPPTPMAQAPAPKPAATPAVAAKPAPAPKPEPMKAAAAPKPEPKPEPMKAAAAPKPEPMPMEPKPEAPAPAAAAPRAPAEPVVPFARVGIAAPGPRFNDIMTAVLYRDLETVSRLVSLGRWVDKRDSNGLTPLMVAAGMGDAEMVQLLLASGADPELQAPGGATARDFALERGDAPTTQLLQRKAPR